MSVATEKAKVQQQSTYVTLIGLFMTLFVAFLARKPRQDSQMRLFDFIMLAIATYRASRLVAYDKVAEPLRAPFTETKPDGSGAGDTVEPKGAGIQKALGHLISCPTCVGTWAAAGLTYGLYLFPNPTRVLLAILSISGSAEILNSLVEDLSWSGREARVQVGKQSK